MKTSFKIILQGSPNDLDEAGITEELLKIEGVCGVHDLHLWSMDGNYDVITIHLAVKNDIQLSQYLAIKQKLS